MKVFFNSTITSTMFRMALISFLVIAIACTTSGKDESNNPTKQEATKEPGDLAGNTKPWIVTVKGKVGFPQPGTITISRINEDGSPAGYQDTIKLKSNYTFAKKITQSEPGFYRVNFYGKQGVILVLDRADVEVNVDGNSPTGFAEIKGSPDLDLITEVKQLQARSQNAPELVPLQEQYAAAGQAKNEARMAEIYEQYMAAVNKYNDQIAAKLEQASPSLAAISLLQSGALQDKDRYLKTYIAIAEKLKSQWPDYSVSKNFIALVDKLKATAIGQVAPEISLPDPNGKIVPLSSLRGKYVLVDFWAKWCGPCRAENPNVVKAYNRFKDKGFTVYGVSLDRNKEDWLKAIQDDNLTWTHVSDLKFWASEAAKTYGISSIPFSLLIDPQGVIIAKNLQVRGLALHKKLEEVLEKK